MRFTFLKDEKTVDIYLDVREIDEIPKTVPSSVKKIEIYGSEYTEIYHKDGTVEELEESPDYIQDLILLWEAAKSS